MENVLNVKIINIQEILVNMNVQIAHEVHVLLMVNVLTKKMIASIIIITEILAKFLVVLLIPFVKNVKEMAHVLNVKMNFILEVHVIHVINALMKNVILMENVKMKILIVKMIEYYGEKCDIQCDATTEKQYCSKCNRDETCIKCKDDKYWGSTCQNECGFCPEDTCNKNDGKCNINGDCQNQAYY